MLSYYAHEVLNSDQREYIKQRELETLDIDNMYGRPVDLINGFFVKTGSVVFEAYSTLEKVEEQIKERIDFYITSDYSEELKIDVFNANLEKAKQSDCVCTFQTDLLSVSNIGLMGSLLGKEKFAAFGDVIVDLSKKMMSAYQVYYDDYKDG